MFAYRIFHSLKNPKKNSPSQDVLKYNFTLLITFDLGGLVVNVLATGPKVRGFDPYRGRWIFKGDKNP
jgi:hypothetical protein